MPAIPAVLTLSKSHGEKARAKIQISVKKAVASVRIRGFGASHAYIVVKGILHQSSMALVCKGLSVGFFVCKK